MTALAILFGLITVFGIGYFRPINFIEVKDGKKKIRELTSKEQLFGVLTIASFVLCIVFLALR